MASLVREVLSATGSLGVKENFNMKATRLKKQIEDLKVGLRKEMVGKYEEFQSPFLETSVMVSQLESTSDEVNMLKKDINVHLKPEMQACTAELKELSEQLDKLSTTVEVANKIKRVYQLIEESAELVDNKKYFEASRNLNEIDVIINQKDVDFNEEDQVMAFNSAKVEFVTIKEKVYFFLEEEWQKLFVWNEDLQDNKLIKVELKNKNNMNDVGEFLQAMNCLDMLSYNVSKMAVTIKDSVLDPILHYQTSILTSDDTLTITIQAKGTPDPRQVLKNVFAIMDHFSNIFGSQFIDETNQMETTLFAMIGKCIADDFIQMLIKDCLTPAIPSFKEHLPIFDKIKSSSEVLHQFLKKHSFIADDNLELTNYAANVNEIFAEKRVADILSKARELMKEDLHITQKIDETQTLSNEEFTNRLDYTNLSPVPILEDLTLPEGFSFQDCLFRCPKCEVSRHVQKILNVIHETMDEATCADSPLAVKLLCTVRMIFDLYCDVLPIYHKEHLKQFPQHCALALTNCMYLGYWCSILSLEYKIRLPDHLQDQFLAFADLIPKVRKCGIEIFLCQLRSQRDQIIDILKDAEFDRLQGEAQLSPKAEYGLKQILHQFNHLRNVWQHTLPSHIYSRSIGILLNSVLDRLIDQVVKLDDIAADSATSIATLFSFFESKAPDLFVIEGDKSSSRHDVVRFVKSWLKFKELILVLNANLREIDDRWACGKGPLAVEFTVEEMKQLIRALFQNTDRRASVLAKIKFEG